MYLSQTAAGPGCTVGKFSVQASGMLPGWALVGLHVPHSPSPVSRLLGVIMFARCPPAPTYPVVVSSARGQDVQRGEEMQGQLTASRRFWRTEAIFIRPQQPWAGRGVRLGRPVYGYPTRREAARGTSPFRSFALWAPVDNVPACTLPTLDVPLTLGLYAVLLRLVVLPGQGT